MPASDSSPQRKERLRPLFSSASCGGLYFCPIWSLARRNSSIKSRVFQYLEVVVTKSRSDFVPFLPETVATVYALIGSPECLHFAAVLSFFLGTLFTELCDGLYFAVCNALHGDDFFHFKRSLKFICFAILIQGQAVNVFVQILDRLKQTVTAGE
jgi:hypothetical protein